MEEFLPADFFTLSAVSAIYKANNLFHLDIRSYNKKVSFSEVPANVFFEIAAFAAYSQKMLCGL
jgi:hypothetical protein